MSWGLAGLSPALMVAEWATPGSLLARMGDNALSDRARTMGAVFALGGLALGLAAALLCGGWRLRRGEGLLAALEHLERVGLRMRPLMLAGLAPPLLDHEVWTAHPILCYGMAIGAAIALSGWAAALPPLRVPTWLPRGLAPAALGALVLGYTAIVSWHHVLHHRALGTSAYDLGIMEQIVRNLSRGRGFECSIEGRDHLEVHASFILAALAPLYALIPRTETLLVVQAVLLGGAAIPLYLLARERLGSGGLALAVAAAWLAHPAVGRANLYDFHELAFAPVLYFLALWCLETERRVGLVLAVALLLAVKEDLSLVVALIGLYALLGGRLRAGLALIGVGGISYLLLTRLVVERSFSNYFGAMIPEGQGTEGLLLTLLVNPLHALVVAATEQKAVYALQIFGPVAFLCFLRGRSATLTLYGLLVCFLGEKEALYQLGFQYALYLVPPAFVGALDALGARTAEGRRSGLVAAGLLGALICWHEGIYGPFRPVSAGYSEVSFAFTDEDHARLEALDEIRDEITAGSSVTASNHIVPHLLRFRRLHAMQWASTRARGSESDYALVFRGARLHESMQGHYALVASNRYFDLYKRR